MAEATDGDLMDTVVEEVAEAVRKAG
jgi:hypothetical protein